MQEILIGIQARSNNSRLPGKCRELIAGLPMLDRVIIACKQSATFVTNGPGRFNVSVCLLVPEGDSLARDYKDRVLVIEGSEDDVLSRYYLAQNRHNPDYMVRVTSDCPMIPPPIISKHIVSAAKFQYDYVSNVDPEVRTSPDGYDVEVISKRLLDWVNENAKSPYDREHVTTYIRTHKPSWAKNAHIIGRTDQSHLKLSVDTQEDLSFVRTYFNILNNKVNTAKNTADGVFRA